jgi:ergothioneine biosynthesis protein EgtB
MHAEFAASTTDGKHIPVVARARQAGRDETTQLLRQTRARTLALARSWKEAVGHLGAPAYAPELNPPLWELGHVAWFMERWTLRNPQRHLGCHADPGVARMASLLDQADDWYDSAVVSHTSRWHLPLLPEAATLDYLEHVLEASLKELASVDECDAALYFWRLCLMHEAMHNEAWVFMAQMLGIELPPEVAFAGSAGSLPPFDGQIALPASSWCLGAGPVSAGFAFDNELGERIVEVDAFEVDARPVSWKSYLAFVAETGHPLPAHVRADGDGWQKRCLGEWQPLRLQDCADHLSLLDAQAWCEWTGRQLPTEAQWEMAATTSPHFSWGQVWEWTGSRFEPYAGFVAHPYREYSQPWFGSHQVLRGASRATSGVIRDWRYRNYYTAQRSDVYAGFRSVAPAQNTAKR